MHDVIYIDTRHNQRTPFSPPEGVGNYMVWLVGRYNAQQYKDGDATCLYGTAQRIHEVLHDDGKRQVIAFGPHAGTVAQFIEFKAQELYSKKIIIEVV